MRRVVIPELLDTDAGTPAEVRGSLRDLRFFNSRFGGVRTTTHLIEQVARQTGASTLSLLEVAAGTGYVAVRTRSRLRHRGIELESILLDRSRAHLNGSERSVVADAR
ncbi:MAG TPA: hypothetical protein VFK81_16635, partial [Terriglobales bacterium]|nr:hypothetical protein [Terriglobales bacterium]